MNVKCCWVANRFWPKNENKVDFDGSELFSSIMLYLKISITSFISSSGVKMKFVCEGFGAEKNLLKL